MTLIPESFDPLNIVQCYTCKKVNMDGVWVKQVIPEMDKPAVTHEYCPKCDDIQGKLMSRYNQRPKRKIMAMPSIAI